MARLSTIAVILAWLFGVLVVVFGRSVIPSKYFTDSDRMAALSEIREPERASKSDLATVQFYRAIGIRGPGMAHLAGLVNLTSACALMLVLLRRRSASIASVALLFPWFAIMALYLSMYSKEFLTVVVVGFVVLGARSPAGMAFAILAVGAYGGLVRAYWLVIVAYGLAFALLGRLRLSPAWKVPLLLGGIFASLVMFQQVTGFHLTDARTLLVAFRAGDPDSSTLVQNVLPNLSPAHDLINLLVGWLRFVVPVTLIRFGGAQHIIFCALQILTVLVVVGRLVTDRRRTADAKSSERAEYVIIVSVGAAVTLVLSAFDGDFGTYARHQIALIPWLIAVLCPTELTKPEVPIVPARSGGI